MSEARAIASRGAPITLSDGSTVHLRYSMLSLEALEADFGSLTGIVEHVENAAQALQLSDRLRKGDATLTDKELAIARDSRAGAIFTELTRVLLPGLIDAQGTDPRDQDGPPVWLEERPDVAKRLLDPGRLREYMDAFRSAFGEAFDTGDEPKAKGGSRPPAGPQAGKGRASRGASGTTSPAASRGGQTRRSGA